MTHQFCIRNTLNEERFYVDGALVIEAFLRLLGRSCEMTRGPVTKTASAQHGLDRQNTSSTRKC
jgi:hypothetical protein